MVEAGAADAEAGGGLVGAEEGVVVEDGGQVAAAAEGRHLVRVHHRSLRRPGQAQQEAGGHQVRDGRGGHRRPPQRQRDPEDGGQALGRVERRHRHQPRPDPLGVRASHHRLRPPTPVHIRPGTAPVATAHFHAPTGTPNRRSTSHPENPATAASRTCTSTTG
ncbi:hypothetical protein [Streptomyces sp. NPDC097619]|uniref:hypothetical protein n=1 Tax=Streptomyces sp. NPDC097619 TaxID=3157228 RepID=UPI003333111E